MRIYLTRDEQEKAIELYLAKQGFDLESKTITCKFSRETVEVNIDEKEVSTKPTIDLDKPTKDNDTFFEEDNLSH